MNKTYLPALVVIALLAGGIALKEFMSAQQKGGPGRNAMAAAVEVFSVEKIVWSVSSEAIGTAYANESVEITSNVSDTVESIQFTDGQVVKKGEVLVVLNHNEEDAELQAAKATLAEQQREVQRLQGLTASKSVSQSLLDERLTQQETAKFRLMAVESRLKDRFIRAPFNGVLGLRNVSAGSFVSPGTVITTLDDIETIKLDFNVPTVYLQDIAQGMKVFATSPALGGREFTGTIASVDSRVNVLDRSLRVRAALPNKDHAIKPGLLMHVRIMLGDRTALVIPEAAIVQNQEKHFVYLVEQGEKPIAQLQEVTIGVRKPGQVEILSGLSEGQLVISRGTNTVRNNGPINIVNQGGKTEG